jgi:hypothetical protein
MYLSVLAEIRTLHLPQISPELYRYTYLIVITDLFTAKNSAMQLHTPFKPVLRPAQAKRQLYNYVKK